jgi:FAD-dependent urate hydroxylase
MPDAPEPAYTGVIGCEGFTHVPGIPPSDGVMHMTFGKRGFFGYQVTPSGEIFWFQNLVRSDEPDRDELDAVSDDEWREELLGAHRHDHEPIAGIIRSTEGRIGRFPIYDIPSLPTWHRGPVCLIEEATHATSLHAGQGASTSSEDAIVLARRLRDLPDSEGAFAAFERLRKGRVERIVAGARRTGNQKVSSNAFTRGLRDLVCRFSSRWAPRTPSGSTRTGWTGARR